MDYYPSLSDAKEHRLFTAFHKFHTDNPLIWKKFVEYARQARAAGRLFLSARMICERIRWYTAIETKSAVEYKISNNNVPFYARMMMHDYPLDFTDFFRTHISADNSYLDAWLDSNQRKQGL